jgi:pyrroline-5-carboxylate reductase
VNIGLIGVGHIARALATGWSGVQSAPGLLCHDVVPGRAEETASVLGGRAASSPRELVMGSDLVIVAVRPQDVGDVLGEIGPVLGRRGVVSVAAGVKIERLQSALPAGARVGRVMPNIAAKMGLGVFLFASGTLGPQVDEVRAVFDTIGITVDVPEPLFDVATSISGCMPGFIGFIVDAFATAGRDGGLDEATARRLATAAAHGGAAFVADIGDPAAAMEAIATPGGMTKAGLDSLQASGVADGIQAAVAAATARAKELAS